MRERKLLKKCPDGCGKDEYDLGEYRGFQLTQKPFYNGWAVYARKINVDKLDKLLLQNETFPNAFFLDTETSDHNTLEECENFCIKAVDDFYKEREDVIASLCKKNINEAKP
jgi:hypothetical protein